MSDASPRVGLVGPRRLRQGLGPYFATYLEEAGARLAAFAVSSPASLAPAAAALAKSLGHPVPGHVGAEAMLAAEPLDAVVIAAPIDAHEPALHAALARGVHVLCEKPLLRPDATAAQRAAELVAGFAARGLLLRTNTQWPCTLAAFYELYPDLTPPHRPRRFDMHLSPMSRGAAMLPDSLPHPLSMLAALDPDPDARAERRRLAWSRGDDGEAVVDFAYVARGAAMDCHVLLRHRSEQPRPAGYAIDGRAVERRVEMPGYRLFFDAPHGSTEVSDPLRLLVNDFVATLRRGPPHEICATLVAQVRMLAAFTVSPTGPQGPTEGGDPGGVTTGG